MAPAYVRDALTTRSLANSDANVQLASHDMAGSNAPMTLPPLRTLFFEDLSVGMTDYGTLTYA